MSRVDIIIILSNLLKEKAQFSWMNGCLDTTKNFLPYFDMKLAKHTIVATILSKFNYEDMLLWLQVQKAQKIQVTFTVS